MMAVLAETGALEPRRPVPAPALLQAVAETARLLDAWDDGRGHLEMLVRLEEGRLAEVRFSPAAGTVCPF
jgi:hypothetical protein